MVAFVYHHSIASKGDILQLNEDIVDQIPFLKALTNQAQLTVEKFDESFVLPLNVTPELFRPIYIYIQQNQWAQLAMRLKRSASFYDLIKLLDFLGLDLPAEVADLEELSNKIRGKQPFELGAFLTKSVHRMVRRKAAVLFLFGLANNKYELEYHDNKQKVISAINHIFSRPEIYTARIRKHAFEVYETELLLQNHISKREKLITEKLVRDMSETYPCNECNGLESDALPGSSDDDAYTNCEHIPRTFEPRQKF